MSISILLNCSKEAPKNFYSKYSEALSICFNGKCYNFYCKDKVQLTTWLDILKKKCIMTNFQEKYNIGDVLGAGGYGKVDKCPQLQNLLIFMF